VKVLVEDDHVHGMAGHLPHHLTSAPQSVTNGAAPGGVVVRTHVADAGEQVPDPGWTTR
jgi:hypothetical protein